MVTGTPHHRRRHRSVVAGVVALLALVMSACGSAANSSTAGSPSSGRHLSLVAAENFWGSLATQLGGSRVTVRRVGSDPNVDPHEYASDASDARAFATADYVILNGAGYDGWADRLLAANPSSSRRVLTVAGLLGRREGDNPHFWYSPDYVVRVADRITSDLRSIDPTDGGYFTSQRAVLTTALGPYAARIAAIRTRFAGRRIAATETVFEYMATALGLVLVSPPAFMKAVAEGNDPPADSVAGFQQAITSGEATALVFNVQTSTDVTTTIKQLAVRRGIPVAAVSETLQPPGASFQDWQLGQLNALYSALDAKAPAR